MQYIIELKEENADVIYVEVPYAGVKYRIQHPKALPKGHGRIIDESKIEVCEWVNELEEDYPKASTDAPTIIKADGGGEVN